MYRTVYIYLAFCKALIENISPNLSLRCKWFGTACVNKLGFYHGHEDVGKSNRLPLRLMLILLYNAWYVMYTVVNRVVTWLETKIALLVLSIKFMVSWR